jgi:hypothetical protein
MGKGARLKRERAKKKNKRWAEIKPGMKLVIPKFEAVKAGATPIMVPSRPPVKFEKWLKKEN